MENTIKFCPNCGSEVVPNDSFCGDCGFDIRAVGRPVQTPVVPSEPRQQRPEGNFENLGRSTSNKSVIVVLVSMLAVLLLVGGGVYWWLAQGNDLGNDPNPNTSLGGQQTTPVRAEPDLTRAATYLSEPGIKGTFQVNYPDGTVGTVERISGQAVPNEAVRVSEVEMGVDQGEKFGYGFHYVERADGTYYILDQSPNEIMPLLKNNLIVGQTWNYQNEFGQIIWTVVDMGVDLDLGFTVFKDCLLLKEDNQMAEFQSITYYAPGRGSVKVVNPSGSMEYYKMTALEPIDLAQAAETIIKWCPNYSEIKDDRTQ